MKQIQPRMTRGALAKRVGVHLETIRFYELKGLLPKPARSTSGYRQYDPLQVQRLTFIKRAQELGFSLKEIKELLFLKSSTQRNSLRVKRLTIQKIESISIKIQDLQKIKKALVHINRSCDGESVLDKCPILLALSGEQKP